jgi:hypothetical protein
MANATNSKELAIETGKAHLYLPVGPTDLPDRLNETPAQADPAV